MPRREPMTSLFEVDGAKCVKCGACVRDCAFRALKMQDGAPCMAFPDRCMKCQHCLAVCPTGAITFDGKRPEDSVPLDGLPLPSLESVENWLRTRRSMRYFADEDVERATLSRILSALGNAPTGCNARALTFTCFPTRASMDGFRRDFISVIERHRDGAKLLPRWLAVPAIRLRNGEDDMFFRGASGMLVVSSDDAAPGVARPLMAIGRSRCRTAWSWKLRWKESGAAASSNGRANKATRSFFMAVCRMEVEKKM